MNRQTKILIMATFIAISFQKVSAQNTFPTPSGSVGIGTTSPTRDLEINSTGTGFPLNSMLIHTGYEDATGLNMESLKIINRMDNGVSYSPNPEPLIFSIWREWITSGSVTSTEQFFSIGMWGAAYFGKSVNINGHLSVNQNGTFQSDLSVNNDASVGHDLSISNELKTNTIAPFSGTDLYLNGIVKTGYVEAGNVTTDYNILCGLDLHVDEYAYLTLGVYTSFLQAVNVVTAGTSMTSPVYYISSDKRLKKNIEPLTSIKEKLFKISPYQYQFDTDASKKWNFNNQTHYGVLAQDVQEIFPELVGTADSEGFLSVNYTEFIPMLLSVAKEQDEVISLQKQTIRSQQEEINELKSQLTDLNHKVNSILQQTGINSTNNDVKSVLEQNVPNPFNSETRIAYNIVEKYTRAFIGVYDLNGKEIKKVALDKAKGEVVFPANNLTPGMYVYSLLVDNQLIDSKKMVIME